MTKDEFNNLIKQTNKKVTFEYTKQLGYLVTSFPFCQTGHLLLSKAFKEQGSVLSEMKIKTAAAYSVDRRVLKKFLLSKVIDGENQDQKEKENTAVNPAKIDHSLDNENKSIDVGPENNPASVIQNHINEGIDFEESIQIIEKEESSLSTDIKKKAFENSASTIAKQIHESLEELRKYKEEEGLANEVQSDKGVIELKEAVDISDQNIKEVSLKPSIDTSTDVGEKEDNSEPELQAISNHLNPPSKDEKVDLDVEGQKDNSKTKAKESKKGGVKLEQGELVKTIPKTPQIVKDKLKELSQKVKKEGEEKRKKKARRRGEIFSYAKTEQVYDSRLGPEGGQKQNSESDLILKYLQSLDKKKENQTEKKEQSLIIDQFIKNEAEIPRLVPKKVVQGERIEDFSKRSTKSNFKIVSENFAKIQLKQGNYSQAIKIYEQLVLKKPEKKAYFVEQILKLKNQQ